MAFSNNIEGQDVYLVNKSFIEKQSFICAFYTAVELLQCFWLISGSLPCVVCSCSLPFIMLYMCIETWIYIVGIIHAALYMLPIRNHCPVSSDQSLGFPIQGRKARDRDSFIAFLSLLGGADCIYIFTAPIDFSRQNEQ